MTEEQKTTMMYLVKLFECLARIMETGDAIGKLFDEIKADDTWIGRLRCLALSLKTHADAGLGLQAPAMFKDIHHEAERLLGHYARAGELLTQACDAIDAHQDKATYMMLTQANKELVAAIQVIKKASKFLKGYAPPISGKLCL